MKKAVFNFIAIGLVVYGGHAQEEKETDQKYDFKCGSLTTKYKKEVTEYKYSTLDDLREGVNEIFQEFDFSKEGGKEKCEITVELKLELIKGFTVVSLSESITNNCTDTSATEAVQRFKSILIAE